MLCAGQQPPRLLWHTVTSVPLSYCCTPGRATICTLCMFTAVIRVPYARTSSYHCDTKKEILRTKYFVGKRSLATSCYYKYSGGSILVDSVDAAHLVITCTKYSSTSCEKQYFVVNCCISEYFVCILQRGMVVAVQSTICPL